MRTFIHKQGLGLLLGSLTALPAFAVDLDGLSVNGFLSAGGGILTGDLEEYRGFDEDFQLDPVTRMGLQVTAQVNDQITATGQLMARGTNDYNVEAEWAYVTWAAHDNVDVRVGRLRSPFFLYSDFLDVGFAYPWITPPQEVYRFPFSTLEGIDALYRTQVGSWDATLQGYYGRLTDEVILLGEVTGFDMKNFTGVNLVLNKDWLTLRASYNYAKLSVNDPAAVVPFLEGLETAGLSDLVNRLKIEDETAVFWGLAVLADYQDWLFTSEYTQVNLDEQSMTSPDTGWYVMVGRRMQDWTVHFTYQVQEDDPDYGILDVIPDGVSPDLDQTKAIARTLLPNRDVSVYSLGFRYDFAPATDFKMEVSRISDNTADMDGTLIQFSIDTVF